MLDCRKFELPLALNVPCDCILQGYLDPEYLLTRKLTDKSDVYSLGVVFLEILTGKQPILHGKNIVREVIPIVIVIIRAMQLFVSSLE